jgi:Immunoglobulin domain
LLQVGWLRAEDQTILTLDTRVVTHNSRISVTHDNHRTWNLHIKQVKEADRGCYMCQINTNVMKKQIGCVDVHGEYFALEIDAVKKLLLQKRTIKDVDINFMCEHDHNNKATKMTVCTQWNLADCARLRITPLYLLAMR